MRIYKIVDTVSKVTHLVKAPSPAAAMRYITQPQFTCEYCSQDDLVALIQEGIVVADSTADDNLSQDLPLGE